MAEDKKNDQDQAPQVGFSDAGIQAGSAVERKVLEILDRQTKTLPDPTPGFADTIPGGVYGFQGRDGKTSYRNANNEPCKKDGTVIGA